MALPARPVPRLPATLNSFVCTIEEGALRRGVPSFVLWGSCAAAIAGKNRREPASTECELGMVGIATMVSKAARGGLRR